jgi:hypothetical protein
MTNNTDPPQPADAEPPDDAFERMARTAGAALRRPAPSDGVARLQSARRRQQLVRTAIASGASAVVVIVGLIVLNRPSEETIAPSDSPLTSTTLVPATTTTSTTTTTTTVPEGLNLKYTLAGIDGLVPSGDPQSSDASNYGTLVSAWSSTAGVTDAYVVLGELSEAISRPGPEGDMTSVSIQVPDGQAYLVTDNGADGLPLTLTSATRVMWWRADGRLWVVSNYGFSPGELKKLTLAIQPGSGLPYVLPDPTMTFVGCNTAESYESVRQDWTLDGSHLTLAVTTGGLAQQLADVTAVSVVERPIAGASGFAITLPNGQVNLAWPTANPDHWASLLVSSPLAPRLDEIIAAITAV